MKIKTSVSNHLDRNTTNTTIDVVLPWQNYRGLSYGNWAALWSNWLLSEEVDTYDGGDILFLRGNVDYQPAGGMEGAPKHIDPNAVFERIGVNGFTIPFGTSIFMPIIAGYYILDELYDGIALENEQQLRYSINKDTSEGGDMWATIRTEDSNKSFKIVPDLKSYRAESPVFKLRVSQNSILNDRQEVPYKIGVHDAVAAGYYLIIRTLPPSTYHIKFGGKGRGAYYTNALYEITVKGVKRDTVRDISGSYPEDRNYY